MSMVGWVRFWVAAMAAWCCWYQAGCRPSESHPQQAPQHADSPASPAPGAPKPAAVADSRPVIACFGDSLTAGQGLDPGQSFPDLLQKDLDSRGLRYRVANMGVSGDTTQDGLERVSLVVAERPAIVLLELGANDGLRGQPVAGTEANLSQMIERLQKSGAKVVLAGITLPPNYGPTYIQQFDRMYRDLAARYKLTTIPFLLAGVGGNPQFMQRDGLHPNAQGTRIVEATVFKTLEPLL
ncbi:MAG TPA: arylesterase [Bryobacteraceae bacterium]|jgi:acyl-CoA thioesterase-1|nr:arylesterase [Bryobacteraceae bacterium]